MSVVEPERKGDPKYYERSKNKMAAQPVKLRPPNGWIAMGKVGIAMLFHDKLKLGATLVGVVFAVLMSNFQVSLFLSLLLRNTMYVDRTDADVWIVPPNTQMLQGADGTLSDNLVGAARGVPGVAWSAPLLMGGAQVKLPDGGNKAVLLVGAEIPAAGAAGEAGEDVRVPGGPIHVVRGDVRDLTLPDAVFMEDSRRAQFGDLNVGSVREMNGHRVQVVGFTSGLLPFGPTFAFASFDTAREILGRPDHEISYVMVGLDPDADREKTLAELRTMFPEQSVLTKDEVRRRTMIFILGESGIGQMIGMGVLMAVFCGFAVVALTMFSSVVENIREFGTLKAIGATNGDLAKLLVVQAVVAGVLGVAIGEAAVSWQIRMMRGPEMPLGIPWWLMLGTFVFFTAMCVAASTLALLRIRNVEPAIVFRG